MKSLLEAYTRYDSGGRSPNCKNENCFNETNVELEIQNPL